MKIRSLILVLLCVELDGCTSARGNESKHRNIKKSFLSDAMREMDYGPVSSNKKGSMLSTHRHHQHHHHHLHHHHLHNKGFGNTEEHQKVNNDGFEKSKITVKIYRPAKLALLRKPHWKHHKATARVSKIDPEVSNAVLPIVRTITNKDSQGFSSQAARKTFAVAKKMFLKVLEGVKNRLKHKNLTMQPQPRLKDLADTNLSNHTVLLLPPDKQAITFHDQDKSTVIEENRRLDQSDQNPDILSKVPMDENEKNDNYDQKEKSVTVQNPNSHPNGKVVEPENKTRDLTPQPLKIQNYDVDINTTLKNFDLVIDAATSGYKKVNPAYIVPPDTYLPSGQAAKSTAEKQKQVESDLGSASVQDMDISEKVVTNPQNNNPGLIKNNPEIPKLMTKDSGVNSTHNKIADAMKIIGQFKDKLKLRSESKTQNGPASHNKNESVSRVSLHSLLADHQHVLGKFDALLKALSNQKHGNETTGKTAKETNLLSSGISTTQKQSTQSDGKTKPQVSKPVQENGYLIKSNSNRLGVGQVTMPPLEPKKANVKNSAGEQSLQAGTVSQQNLKKQSETISTGVLTEAIPPELQKPIQKIVSSLQQVTSGSNNKQERTGVKTFQVQGKGNTTKNKLIQSEFEGLNGLLSLMNKTANQKGLFAPLNNYSANPTGQSKLRNNTKPTKLTGHLAISQNPNSDHPNMETGPKRPNLDLIKSVKMETSSTGNGTASMNSGNATGQATLQLQTARNISDKNNQPLSNKNRLLELLHNNTIINLLDNALTSPAQLSNSNSSVLRNIATRNSSKGTANTIKNFHVSKQLAASRKAFETAKKLIQATLAREELYKAEKVFQEKLKEMLKKTDSTPGLKKINAQSDKADTQDTQASSQSDLPLTAPNMAVPSTPTAADAQAQSQPLPTQDKQMQETADKAAHLEEKIAKQQEKMYQELANGDASDDNGMQEEPGTGSIRNEEEEEPMTSRDKHENYGDFQDIDEEEQKGFYLNRPMASYAESDIDSSFRNRGYLRDRVGLPLKEDEYSDNVDDANNEDPDDGEPHPYSMRDEISAPAKHLWKDSTQHPDTKQHQQQQRSKLSAGVSSSKTRGSNSDEDDDDDDNDNNEREEKSDDEAIVQPEDYARVNDVSFSDTEDLGGIEEHESSSKTRKKSSIQTVAKKCP